MKVCSVCSEIVSEGQVCERSICPNQGLNNSRQPFSRIQSETKENYTESDVCEYANEGGGNSNYFQYKLYVMGWRFLLIFVSLLTILIFVLGGLDALGLLG